MRRRVGGRTEPAAAPLPPLAASASRGYAAPENHNKLKRKPSDENEALHVQYQLLKRVCLGVESGGEQDCVATAAAA
jgi:hypothetical protein